MNRYRYLLFDVDDTLIAFAPAEKAALETLFRKYGFGTLSEEMLRRYLALNRRWWQALERGEVTREALLPGRFREFFTAEGLDASRAESFNADYQLALGDIIVFCEGAKELLASLRGRYILAAVTNGTKAAQMKKLTASGLIAFFDDLFISEDIGYEKPSPDFFRAVWSKLGITDGSEALLIGDSLTGDIAGAGAAGCVSCWYNPSHKENHSEFQPDFEIDELKKLYPILGE